ncbi:MAG: GNAT family N-acetyltransferase [Angelakisella sp.]
MSEIVVNRPGELSAIIQAANAAFSDLPAGGFAALLPKLYGEQVPYRPNHLLIKENGEIKSLVLAHRDVISVLGTQLAVAGVGTVSVTPDARGKGYMQQLMAATVEKLKNDGCALSVLDGNRQRYEYFGYCPAGSQWRCDLTPANVKHALGQLDDSGLALVPMTANHPLLGEAVALHNSKPCHVVRDGDSFVQVLRSWLGEPYLVLQNGKLAGVFTLLPGDKRVLAEATLYDDALFLTLCKAIVVQLSPHGLRCQLPLWEQAQLGALEAVCEGGSLFNNHNFLIVDFLAVIDAFLRLKGSYQRLSDGSVTLAIDGRCLRLSVVEGQPAVAELPTGSTVALSLTAAQATRLLFAQLGVPRPAQLPADWFPLPLAMPSQDCC